MKIRRQIGAAFTSAILYIITFVLYTIYIELFNQWSMASGVTPNFLASNLLIGEAFIWVILGIYLIIMRKKPKKFFLLIGILLIVREICYLFVSYALYRGISPDSWFTLLVSIACGIFIIFQSLLKKKSTWISMVMFVLVGIRFIWTHLLAPSSWMIYKVLTEDFMYDATKGPGFYYIATQLTSIVESLTATIALIFFIIFLMTVDRESSRQEEL